MEFIKLENTNSNIGISPLSYTLSQDFTSPYADLKTELSFSLNDNGTALKLIDAFNKDISNTNMKINGYFIDRIQKRKNKRKRINKKWAKRYGYKYINKEVNFKVKQCDFDKQDDVYSFNCVGKIEN